jgi:hypothetical protein
LQYLKRSFKDKKDMSSSISISEFVKKQNNKEYLMRGVKILKELVEICKEKNLQNDFIVSFLVSLKETKEVKRINKANITLESIVKIMNKNIKPQIVMTKKISRTKNYNSVEERYRMSLGSKMLKEIFKEEFIENYYMCYICYKKKEAKSDSYGRYIDILYNENYCNMVKNIDKIAEESKKLN